MHPNIRALKLQARAAMRDSQPRYWKVALVYLLLVSILPNLIYEIFDASLFTLVIDTMASHGSLNASSLLDAAMLGLFVSLVVSLVSMVVEFGFSLWALRCWRKEPENGVGSLLEGFAMVGRILLCNVLVWLNILAWIFLLTTALSTVFMALIGGDLTAPNYLLIGFYFVTVVIACCMIVIRYALVYYVLIDRPELSVLRCVALGVSMTRGRLWQLLRLYLSFAAWIFLSVLLSEGVSLLVVHLTTSNLMDIADPWAVLELSSGLIPYWAGVLSGCLIALYVSPYITVTIAGFYDSLLQPPQPQTAIFHDDIY